MAAPHYTDGTWTYSANSLGTDLAKVRAKIGDTNSDRKLLSDAEVNLAIAETATLNAAAAQACRAIAAKFAPETSRSSNNLTKGETQFSHFEKLAEFWQSRSSRLGGLRAGGVSEAAVAAVQDDTDRVAPAFKVGMLDHPGTAV